MTYKNICNYQIDIGGINAKPNTTFTAEDDRILDNEETQRRIDNAMRQGLLEVVEEKPKRTRKKVVEAE